MGSERGCRIVAYEIGSRIRYYREAKGLTQKQLADLIGVTNSRVSNWEQCVNRPDVDLLASICKALDVSPSEILDVHLSTDELTDHERRLILAYREKTNLKNAVDLLLGLEGDTNNP